MINNQNSYTYFSMIIQHASDHWCTASEMCIYTNDQFLVEAMDVEEEKSEDGKEQTVYLSTESKDYITN